MHALEVAHWTLVQKRTQIRHDKLILRWIQRCWLAATGGPQPRDSANVVSLNRDGYTQMYRKLLAAMTITWDEEVFITVVDEMWCRDAHTFADLDGDRFSCSIFAFVEMWVETLEVAEYARVLQLIHRILSTATHEHAIRRSNPTALAAFFDALRQERQLDASGVSIGKSTLFDPERYAQTFGRAVPDAISGVVASVGTKPARRHTGPQLSAASTARLGNAFDAKFGANPRPRSCSVMVRTADATVPSAASGINIVNSRKLVIYRPRTTKEAVYRIKS